MRHQVTMLGYSQAAKASFTPDRTRLRALSAVTSSSKTRSALEVGKGRASWRNVSLVHISSSRRKARPLRQRVACHSHSHSHSGNSIFGVAHGHSHGGHEHGHGFGDLFGLEEANGGHDDERLTKAAAAVTWAGAICNVLLSVAKGIVGFISGSSGLLADAIHSFSDLITDAVTIFSIRIAKRKADSEYPYGYGKWDSVCAALIACLIILSTLGLAQHALSGLFSHLDLSGLSSTPLGSMLLHSHSHAPSDLVAVPAAMFVAIISILTKEVLYQVTAQVARITNSPVLMANGVHHRADAITSVLALGMPSNTVAGKRKESDCSGFGVQAAYLGATRGIQLPIQSLGC
eukprot:scaffold620_cov386-Prasinococcus_capsulatus_cf.AAC.18